MICGRVYTMKKNEILTKFVREIERESESEFLDMENFLNEEQKQMYLSLEGIVKELFADNKNIYDGVRNIANGDELTTKEQLFVLMSLKLYEISFLAMMDSGKMEEIMKKAGTMMPPPMGDNPSYQ
jgi:hypothetical protein